MNVRFGRKRSNGQKRSHNSRKRSKTVKKGRFFLPKKKSLWHFFLNFIKQKKLSIYNNALIFFCMRGLIFDQETDFLLPDLDLEFNPSSLPTSTSITAEHDEPIPCGQPITSQLQPNFPQSSQRISQLAFIFNLLAVKSLC